MTPTRKFQSAILTATLLVVGAACGTSATTSPADTTPVAEPVEVAFSETDSPNDTESADSDVAPTPTTEPEPSPDPTVPQGPADPTDDDPVDPDPGPDPVDLLAPSDDPDPTPELELGVLNGTIPPVIDPVIVANIPACGLYLPIPANASNVASVFVDAFGDGSADDMVTSYYDVDNGQWRIRLIPSAGGVSEVTVTGVGPGYVEVLGAVHVDTDDAEQILAVVGSGASALVLGVFGADAAGCLFQFDWHGTDEHVTFAVGATVGNMSGLLCYESDGWRYLSSMSAVSNGPGSGTWNIYGSDAIRESEQTLQAGDGLHVFGVPDGDAQLAAVATVDCPGITL